MAVPWRRWAKRVSIAILSIAVLVMTVQVWNVPDYHGGKSYVSYSPSGEYRVDYIFPQHSHTDLRIFTANSNGNVIAIVPTPSSFIGDVNPLWVCNDDRSICYEHDIQTSYGVPVSLPPSWWRRLHAWLTIHIRHLEDPQLKVVEVSERYPPVCHVPRLPQ